MPRAAVKGYATYGYKDPGYRRIAITGTGFKALVNPVVLLAVPGSTILFKYKKVIIASDTLMFVDFKYDSGNKGYGGDTDNVTITITDQGATVGAGDVQAAADMNTPP
jgi:hypothetical protein